jgi:putative flippase GtrA
MKKTKLNYITPRFRRYLIIGIAAFSIEYVSFAILSTVGAALIISQSLSFFCGLMISFVGNRKVTFNSIESSYALSSGSQLWRYALLALINLILSNVALYVLVEAASVNTLISKIVVMVAVVGWNYVLFNKIIFRTNQH